MPKEKILTNEMIDFLRENYKNSNARLEKLMFEKFSFKISSTKITEIRKKYQIPKSGLTGQYEKGHSSYNKGLKWDDYMSKESQEGSRRTTFKKGHINYNTAPLYAEGFTKDRRVIIKIGQPNKWQLKSRYMYEKYHNVKLKNNERVTFLNQNPYDFSKENLAIITPAQAVQMISKGLYTKNRNLTSLGLDVVKLKEKIKEKKKNEK